MKAAMQAALEWSVMCRQPFSASCQPHGPLPKNPPQESLCPEPQGCPTPAGSPGRCEGHRNHSNRRRKEERLVKH